MRIRNISHSSRSNRYIVPTIFLCLIIFNSTLHGQQSTPKPLEEIIPALETRWAPYKFTYADDIIKNIYLVPPSENLQVEEGLRYLEARTSLSFTIINTNFIGILQKTVTLQKICGRIIDAETNEMVSKAFIEANKNTTVSDQDGYFEMEVPENTTEVSITHLGYKTADFSLTVFKTKDCASIFLYKETEALDPVIVSDFLTEGIGKTASGGFKIDYSNFGILPGLIESDVLQTIQALPGVQSADETISNINIRGGAHDQNLLLWDGIKMYQTGHFFGLISVFNPNITDKTTVLKNGTSSEYSDGVSGSILMNSSNLINRTFTANVGINLINADIFADIPITQRSSLQVSGRTGLNKYLETPTYRRYFDRISQNTELSMTENQQVDNDIVFDFYDVNLRWNCKITPKDKLRLNILLIHDELFLNESATLDGVLSSRESSLIQNSLAGGIYYQKDWNSVFSTSLQAYETYYKLEGVNSNLIAQQRFLQENIVSETSVKLKSNYKRNNSVRILGGYQFIETGITNLNDIDTPRFREKQVRVIREHAIFSEIKFTPEEKSFNLNFGARFNYNEKFKQFFIEPRLSFNQKFLNYFNLMIQGEVKHQYTSQIINRQNEFFTGDDFLGVERRRWNLANNDNVPITQGQQFSLGVHYNYSGLLISGEVFVKNITGITSESQGFQNLYKDVSAQGSYAVRGIEFMTNKRFKDVSTWIGYTFAQNDYTFDQSIDQVFPNTVDIRHAISLGAVYNFKNFKISAGLNWHSGLPTTIPSSVLAINGDINFEPENRNRLDPYFRADLSVNYDFKVSKVIKGNLGFSLWNLSNQENVISTFYRVFDENFVEELNQNALKLTPNAVLRLSL